MPRRETVKKALKAIKRGADYKYFFDHLKSPEWIKPLWKEGFFRDPPKPIKEGEYISFPSWPESIYLARMAPLNPKLVLEVILQIPDVGNARIYQDLIDAALKMPPELAACLVEKTKKWAKSLYLSVPEKLGQLISHLAEGGKTEEALEIAEVLLDIIPDSSSIKDIFPPEPRPRFDIWSYEQILKENYPQLIKESGLPAFKLLCDLLEKAVHLSQREKYEKPVDLSYIWRPAIEDHLQNTREDVKNVLVNAVRDAADLLIKEGLLSIEETIHHLEKYSYPIFKRIILYLLWRFPEKAGRFIPQYLINNTLFNDPHFRHEYNILLRKYFKNLDNREKKQIIRWLEQGPDPELLKDKSPGEKEQLRKLWLRNQLARFNLEDLPREWQKVYKELVEKFGEPEHPDFVFTTSTWIGPTSPLTKEAILQKSIDELIEFLKSWSPPEIPFGEPSPEGLGRELASAVAEQPERFAIEAKKFKGTGPTYVRHLISGFTEALKEGKSFPWEQILNLCEWAISQPREISKKRKIPFGFDPDWGWTRKEIASLLETGLEKYAFPFKLRERIWKILEPLTEDPEPTREEEEKRFDLHELEWPTLAINSVRGRAFHAIIKYAIWVRQNLKKQKVKYQGFSSIPEVKEVLEKHLDPSHDPSLAIRSIYGQWLPWLIHLDSDWIKENLSKIFPEDNPKLRKVAWESYLVFNRASKYLVFNKASKEVYELLKDQYAQAVNTLSLDLKDKDLKETQKSLANHLMIFYALGSIEWDDPIFQSFWENAGPLRKEALEFIGRLLYQSKISQEFIKRFQKLWESYWYKFQDSFHKSPDKYKPELATFGWWFISEKFDVSWAINRLLEVLQLTRKIEPARMVLQHLTKISEKYLREAIKSLKLIAEGDQEGWVIYTGRKYIREILEKAMRDSKARSDAEPFVHYLGSRGFFEFRDLLRKN
ncbi:hypothetical protein [Thermosulfurimonas dismutans]|uniref:Uncharacterized protein n=1 Tax=Thermosulfurimonas dismutans TaxID=999894 RepID=A0A179D612_9BACT|nr:hypothetical protein [Thermosulfurimonas dismutans]OAQ21540.1 hypothetical protein TDIS_0058 [Thermosulfurimonas dismutans]